MGLSDEFVAASSADVVAGGLGAGDDAVVVALIYRNDAGGAEAVLCGFAGGG